MLPTGRPGARVLWKSSCWLTPTSPSFRTPLNGLSHSPYGEETHRQETHTFSPQGHSPYGEQRTARERPGHYRGGSVGTGLAPPRGRGAASSAPTHSVCCPSLVLLSAPLGLCVSIPLRVYPLLAPLLSLAVQSRFRVLPWLPCPSAASSTGSRRRGVKASPHLPTGLAVRNRRQDPPTPRRGR